MLKDDNLVRASDEIFRNVTANHRAAAQALIQNIEEFNDVFLPIELDKMRAKGFNYPAITDALQVASKTRPSASVRDLTAAEVLSSVNMAQSQVCQFAQSEVSDRQRAQTAWTFSGIVLMVVDIGAGAAIAFGTGGSGMPALGTVVLASVTVGSAAAFAGIKGNIP